MERWKVGMLECRVFFPTFSRSNFPSPSEVNSQILPDLIDPLLCHWVHNDLVRPIARESFFLPLPRRVDAHFRAVGEASAGVIEHVDRPHGKAHVALGIDMIECDPPRFLGV